MTTQRKSMPFSQCVDAVEQVLGAVEANYPRRTIVRTAATRVDKLWTNDAALTLTCNADDGVLIMTKAPYQ